MAFRESIIKWTVFLSLTVSLVAQTYSFSDGGKRIRVEFAPNEAYIAVKPGGDRLAAIASLKRTLGRQVRATAPAGETGFILTLSRPARAAVKGFDSAAPVFYDSAENAAERRGGARRIMTKRVLVRMDDPAEMDTLPGCTQAPNPNKRPIKR